MSPLVALLPSLSVRAKRTAATHGKTLPFSSGQPMLRLVATGPPFYKSGNHPETTIATTAFRPKASHQMVPTVVPRFSERCPLWCHTARTGQRSSWHRFARKNNRNGSPQVATRSELARRYAKRHNDLRKRRARGSNPQPLTGHHISSVAANHSLTLRKYLRYTSLRYALSAVKPFCSRAPTGATKAGD